MAGWRQIDISTIRDLFKEVADPDEPSQGEKEARLSYDDLECENRFFSWYRYTEDLDAHQERTL